MQGVKETQFPGQLLAASSLLKIFRKTAIFKASLQMFKHVFRGGSSENETDANFNASLGVIHILSRYSFGDVLLDNEIKLQQICCFHIVF